MVNTPTPARPARRLQVLALAGLAIAIIVTLVAISCQATGPAPPAPGPGPTTGPAETVFRLVGSNTVGDRLAPDLMEKFLTAEGAANVRREKAGGVTNVTGTLSGRGPVRFEIHAEGTETGFTALRENTAEMAMASRKITDQEVRDLAARGTLDDRDSEVVLAVDAVAVIVPRERSLSALTLDQLRDIFTCSGTTTEWSAVGGATGPSGRIHVLAMDDASATFETFRDVVLRGQQLCASAERYSDHRKLSDDVAGDPLAIGFVSLPYAAPNQTLALSGDGTASLPPSPETVSLESYLMIRRLYLYLPTRPTDDPLLRKSATSFAVSDAGQAVVVGNGFVSAYPPPQPAPTPCTTNVQEYCAATADAERVPFDVRFDTGTYDVDNRAFRNLDLLVEQLKRPENAGKRVELVGFTDNVGSDDRNRPLSTQRAESVQAYLTERGITAVTATGLGATLSVATNDTPEGRELNRRVEVWLR